mgnify:FL=1
MVFAVIPEILVRRHKIDPKGVIRVVWIAIRRFERIVGISIRFEAFAYVRKRGVHRPAVVDRIVAGNKRYLGICLPVTEVQGIRVESAGSYELVLKTKAGIALLLTLRLRRICGKAADQKG